jgi:hypothetical protein
MHTGPDTQGPARRTGLGNSNSGLDVAALLGGRWGPPPAAASPHS